MKYANVMLTIIALACSTIAAVVVLKAVSYGGSCGHPDAPCFVSTSSKDWLAVRVLP